MVTPRENRLVPVKPKGRGRRFRSIGLRSLLMLMTLFCFIFASEASHHFHQRKVIEQLPSDGWDGEVRYSWLALDHFRWLEYVFGPNWNLDVVSVNLHGMAREKNHLLLQHMSKLKRLRIVSIHYGSVNESDVRNFKHFRSLQWLGLIECDADLESVVEVRQHLPNTYVSYIP